MAVVNPVIDPLQADQTDADAWRGESEFHSEKEPGKKTHQETPPHRGTNSRHCSHGPVFAR